MNIHLTQLLMCYIAGWGKEIEYTYNAFASFCRKYEVHTPTFLETDSLDDLRQGKIKMHPIPAGNLFDMIDYLKDNPSVRFKSEDQYERNATSLKTITENLQLLSFAESTPIDIEKYGRTMYSPSGKYL